MDANHLALVHLHAGAQEELPPVLAAEERVGRGGARLERHLQADASGEGAWVKLRAHPAVHQAAYARSESKLVSSV